MCTTPDAMRPPLFFHPGIGEIWTKTDYRKLIAKLPTVHKGAMRMATKMVSSMPQYEGEELRLQHRPEL
jgi:hypothetical protein